MRSYHPRYAEGSALLEDVPFAIDSSTVLTQGLIDLQVNGVYGVDFSSLQFTPQEVARYEEASRLLASHGVTRFLATKISSPPESYTPEYFTKLLSKWNDFSYAQCSGWHLEGPYINPLLSKAHSSSWMNKPFDKERFREIFSTGAIKLVTLAPESRQGHEMLELALGCGVATSLGHTAAEKDDVDYARSAGCGLITHLFNGLLPFHQRHSGLIGRALGDRDFFFTLISDGVHVDDAVIRMAYNASKKKLILASDICPLAGSGNESSTFGTDTVRRYEGRAVNSRDVLAGSLHFLDEQMAHFRKVTGSSFEYVLEAVTQKPNEALQCLSFCNDKDVLLWQNEHIMAVWIDGSLRWVSE